MRIISGKYKGKNLIGFDIMGTRPTMDRVKESLFASIQNYIKEDSCCLDLFAGSGSLGIEAISNGARSCYFVDNNSDLINIVRSNTKEINEEIHIIKNDYDEALKTFHEEQIKFDIIFLDPPYKMNLINNCLNKIHKYELLNDDGIIVCEFETEVLENNNYKILKNKKYGSKNITIYTM